MWYGILFDAEGVDVDEEWRHGLHIAKFGEGQSHVPSGA